LNLLFRKSKPPANIVAPFRNIEQCKRPSRDKGRTHSPSRLHLNQIPGTAFANVEEITGSFPLAKVGHVKFKHKNVIEAAKGPQRVSSYCLHQHLKADTSSLSCRRTPRQKGY